jgi:hypothetical protein
MSDISPEDRQRLAKATFKEWFNELFEEQFNEHFEKKRAPSPQHQGQTSAPQGTAGQQAQSARKRSLFEECISQTLGIG